MGKTYRDKTPCAVEKCEHYGNQMCCATEKQWRKCALRAPKEKK